MSFVPALPLGGLGGWRLLERTEASQRAAFEKSPEMARDVAYFREKIASIDSAEALVGDYRLLRVALGAFGLDADVSKQAFIRKVLESDPLDSASFANRLVDSRYHKLAAAFGFGGVTGPKTGWSGFAEKIVEPYKSRQFDIAVGVSDESMRLALNFRREIATHSDGVAGDNAAWFKIMGDPPVRKVLEAAFNLDKSIGTLDIDQQLVIFKDAARKLFGDSSPTALADSQMVDLAIRRFLLRTEIEAGPTAATPGFAALSILRGGGAGASLGIANLLLSRA